MSNISENHIFRIPISNKIYPFFLLFAIFSILALGFISEGANWPGVVTALIVCLIFDFHFKKLFCVIEITNHMLIFKPGGIFWKLFYKEYEFNWGEYNFIVYYYNYKNEMHYSSLKIYNKSGKKCLTLKAHKFPKFSVLVHLLEKTNKDTRIISIEMEIRNRSSKIKWYANVL